MYKEYDVERGRKDHWASYDAPKTIEVIKEPLERNDWWWGRFEGEDSKIDVSVRPKTAQEIIDNIQIRINAPFYIWNNQQAYQPPSPSRTGLYQLCNRDTSGESDPSKWLTLYYLLAAGDRKAAVDWSRSVGKTSRAATPPAADRKASGKPGRISQLPSPISQLRDRRRGIEASDRARNSKFSLNGRFLFDATKSIQRDSGIALSKRLQVSDFRSNFRSKQQSSLSLLPAVSAYRSASKKELAPRSLLSAGPIPLSPEMSFSVAQAIGKRWSRLERDIEKYNSQHHYGWGGRWNQWDSIDAQNLSSTWYGNQIEEILEGMEFGEEADEELELSELQLSLNFDIPMSGPSMDAYGFMNQSLATLGGNVVDGGFGGARRMGNGLFDLSLGEDRSARFAWVDSDTDVVMDGQAGSEFRLDALSVPKMYVAASQRPIQTQPGMTAILAADHLSKRLGELETLAAEQPDGLNKQQLAEQRAVQVAIKNVERTGARLEKSGQFWGYQGWSYRPRPQTINPPTIQAYSGYQWSFDLTRYADGLYSNTNDMIEEVAQQYGSPKPLGKIDDQSREKIENARSNFKTVEVQFDDQANKFLVGPGDKFAFSSTSDMYLTEQFVCDGQQIVQIYDEIGIAARRSATKTRLDGLRQLAPHMVPDVDSLIEQFDVQLIQSDDKSTTIKLTAAEPQQKESENADSGSVDEKLETENETQEDETQEDESDSACLIVKFDNQGRVLTRELLYNDEPWYSIDFSYEDDKVTMKWKVQVETEADDSANEESEDSTQEVASAASTASFETGESSYHCKQVATTESMFEIDLDLSLIHI